MRIVEMMKLNRDALKYMHEKGVNAADVRYIRLYDEYVRLLEEGRRKQNIVWYLSDVFSVSEASVYRIIGKFECEVGV